MALDKELVNFGEEHELNTILSKFGKSQSQKNARKNLLKEC